MAQSDRRTAGDEVSSIQAQRLLSRKRRGYLDIDEKRKRKSRCRPTGVDARDVL